MQIPEYSSIDISAIQDEILRITKILTTFDQDFGYLRDADLQLIASRYIVPI